MCRVSSTVNILDTAVMLGPAGVEMLLKNETLIPFGDQRDNCIAGSLRKCHFKLHCANIMPHDLKFIFYVANSKTWWVLGQQALQ